MILGNKTLMCPWGRAPSPAVEIHGQKFGIEHTTPIIIVVHLGFDSRGPTIKIKLSCPDCGWKANKEISLLKMMERTALCPTNDISTTGSKAS